MRHNISTCVSMFRNRNNYSTTSSFNYIL